MSDLDIWKEFFNKYNITFTETQIKSSSSDLYDNSIMLESGNGEGYAGFTFTGIFFTFELQIKAVYYSCGVIDIL